MNGDFGTSPLKKGVSQMAWPAYPPFSCLANSKECYPSNGFAGAPTRRQSFQDPRPSIAEHLDINIVVINTGAHRSKPIFASHSAICCMGDPVPIYRQPAEPHLTSSDHEVIAAFRSSGMSGVGQRRHSGRAKSNTDQNFSEALAG